MANTETPQQYPDTHPLTPQQQTDAHPVIDTHPVTPLRATDNHAMTRDEFADLRAAVARVQDNVLQPVLREIINNIGHLHGFDAADEDKRIAKEAQDRADAQAKIDKEQADKDSAAADTKAAQAKRDLFVSMFGGGATVPTASPNPPLLNKTVSGADIAEPITAPNAGGVVTGTNTPLVGHDGPEIVTPALKPTPAPQPKPTPDPAAKA